MFLGNTFSGGLYALDSSTFKPNTITKLIITSAEVNELFVTSDTPSYSTTIPSVWDIKTLLHAGFNNDLLGGNINFYINEINMIRLKRRIKGSVEWVVLHEKPILSGEDLNIVWSDITARSGITYEYTVVPVFDEVEGSFYTNEITADFRGLFIMDKENIFTTDLDVIISEKRNKPRSIVTTINRKYPYIVSNGTNNYDSGSVSAQFIEYNPTTNIWDIDGARQYVRNLKDFLNNGDAKILKYEDGRMWLIEVSSSEITDSEDDYHAQVHTSFEWTEIGDCNSTDDLYINNIIDVTAG